MDTATLTESDYDVLADMFRLEGTVFMGPGPAIRAYKLETKKWLESCLSTSTSRHLTALYCLLQMDLEEMPLYINHPNSDCRALAKWRLRIGR